VSDRSQAIERYQGLLFPFAAASGRTHPAASGTISSLEIFVESSSENLQFGGTIPHSVVKCLSLSISHLSCSERKVYADDECADGSTQCHHRIWCHPWPRDLLSDSEELVTIMDDSRFT
jgi:hypothetical protein